MGCSVYLMDLWKTLNFTARRPMLSLLHLNPQQLANEIQMEFQRRLTMAYLDSSSSSHLSFLVIILNPIGECK